MSDNIVVNVIDAPCGAGKTSAAINYINSATEDKHFIYVTPFLDEVERIIKNCSKKKFQEPKKYGSKLLDLKRLLRNGQNIATTHALFHFFDNEVADLCYTQNYVLIMDEVSNVISSFNNKVSLSDRQTLFDKYVDIREDGVLVWRKDQTQYEGVFTVIKQLIDAECLACYNSESEPAERRVVVWLFPVNIFRAFRESYILTYMFDAQMQRYYYDFNNVTYRYKYVTGDSVENYSFTDKKVDYKFKYDYSQLIWIINDKKLNGIDDKKTAFSVNWYRNIIKNKDLVNTVRSNLNNFLRNKKVCYKDGVYTKSKVADMLWTTFSEFKPYLCQRGYVGRWKAFNARATNEFINATVVAYMVNVYVNPDIIKFFQKHGITVDVDRYATSEMIQFIWRSGIRTGKHITVYIPSQRMRTLLALWILHNSPEHDYSKCNFCSAVGNPIKERLNKIKINNLISKERSIV